MKLAPNICMNIKTISDAELVLKTKRLVQEERAKTLEVLESISEIYRRRIHLAQGYASLREFLVKVLSYSDGAAHRRIAAMRLCNDVPTARESLATGALSLSTASTVQGFFRAEKEKNQKTYSQNEKRELLQSLEGASREKCVQKLAALSPAYAAQNSQASHYLKKSSEITIPKDEEIVSLMSDYRDLAMLCDGTPESIVRSALKTAVAALKSRRLQSERMNHKQNIEPAGRNNCPASLKHTYPPVLRNNHPASKNNPSNAPSNLPNSAPAASSTRYIPAAVKRAVWARDRGRCTFKNHATGLLCEARTRLQYEHIVPFAHDGENTAENLTLLCRAHNALRAVQVYGQAKIDGFQKRA